MNDFKSYSHGNAQNGGGRDWKTDARPNDPNGQQGNPVERNGGSSQNKGDPALNNTVEMAKIITRAMNGKSTAQIMHTIIAEAERGKREGTLTNADLDGFYSALSPLLDGVKRKKLKQVIDRLKEI